jgi:ubiquinone/menaquinone biosynthesis C-methylase UbiE
MDGTILPSQLHWWPGRSTTLAEDLLGPDSSLAVQGPHRPEEFAARLYACEALQPPAPIVDETAEPYTLQWFLEIESQRHGKHGRWIPRLLEFAKHPGETLLGLGHGLGTDWLQYARHGAQVIVCSPSSEQLRLIRCNFEVRDLRGRFVHTDFASLPLETNSIDVACVTSLLSEVADPQPVIGELYRVLKPGGKVLALASAKYDVDYWYDACLPLQRWLMGPRQQPALMRYSARRLRLLFAPFIDHHVYKRHLRRKEVPHLWRWLPMHLLERIIGRVLVLKAFKPVSAARVAAATAAA